MLTAGEACGRLPPGRRWSSLWNLEELKLERRQIPRSRFQAAVPLTLNALLCVTDGARGGLSRRKAWWLGWNGSHEVVHRGGCFPDSRLAFCQRS